MGPGFDCLGLALDLHLEVSAREAVRDGISYRGEGSIPNTPKNLVHQGFHAVCRELGERPPPVHFDVDNPIPLARGLGSSSAALVAGAALADAMLEHRLGRDEVFQVTARMEGHPDNVGPAVYGGFTVAAADDTGSYAMLTLPLPDSWTLLFGVPDFELLTLKTRAVLPEAYSRADAVLTSSRAALLTAAVASDRPELLPVAISDVLHEPYRKPLIPGFGEVKRDLVQAGAQAVYLSGGGPTVAVIALAPDVTDTCREVLGSFVTSAGRVLEARPAEGYHYVGEATEDRGS